MQADVLILDVPSIDDLVYQFGTNNVSTVIKEGKILVKDREIVTETK